ncbi:MAG: hypothetical protein LBT10_04100, partial [Methanobrevibacter sp.]|nr:hypothetical protein [Methanobrevibacter sp.]
MIRKLEFLDKCRAEINHELNSFVKHHPYDLSKKLIKSFISEIFIYLRSNDVYVNVHDPNFIVLIWDDLEEMIINFLKHDHDAEFLRNFKSSIRHQPSKERDGLMVYDFYFAFEQFRNILDLVHNPSSLGGRPP